MALRLSVDSYFGFALIGSLIGIGASAQAPPPSPPLANDVAPLSLNDVSWLFPPPKTVGDLTKLIALKDLGLPDPKDPGKVKRVWSDLAFKEFQRLAAAGEGKRIEGERSVGEITLPEEATHIENWYVAGVRFDAGAPGLSDKIIAQFGQAPQIRLIVQPVGKKANKGALGPFDIAGHLVFNLILGVDDPNQEGCSKRFKPDMDTFRKIVADLAAFRTDVVTISTAGSLRVHPGLADPKTSTMVRQAMKDLLEKYILDERLSAMAIAAVPSETEISPWIFLSMAKNPQKLGEFRAVPGPTLDGIRTTQTFTGSVVDPAPNTNNKNAITCKSALTEPLLPIKDRAGVSTNDFFTGKSTKSTNLTEVLNVIADPDQSHFFNTDCVSCHTESVLGQTRPSPMSLPDIDPNVLTSKSYTVRNFGWAPPVDGVQAVVARRAATETRAVVDFINKRKQ